MVRVFALLALLVAAPTSFEPMTNMPPPAMNLSNIHAIYCVDNGTVWQGSGWLIAKGIMATANHVAGAKCYDATANTELKTYKTDKRHDFALMTGKVSAIGPYTKYVCDRPNPKDYYLSYGWSSAGMPNFFQPILRNNVVRATQNIQENTDAVPEFQNSQGMRTYVGPDASGVSGGPVADLFGNVVAINNAGNNKASLNFDLADTGLCTGKWD